ncbi:Ferric reductase like transmembrane component [Ceratocystis platani]|uniref:Ferric reductase like transmembrane component n=1 Tax=Ceratocystis fimbriata f. sp. platani TaxID=88771 RepID=A0A0F8DP49_CERFI|nr:Ferric reductase like transmembrane component [Ceratocystis platani]
MKGSSRVVAVFVLLAAFAGLCIGLTFVPCYATLCSEDYFPRETRLHLATFYGLLTVTACMLLFRTSGESLRYLSSTHISPELPILGKRITLGGFIVSLWILLITLGTTAFWLPAHLDFWAIRTDPLNWTSAKIQLTVTGVTGHYADIMLGLLIIPISRNSLVGRAFGLHQSTLVYAHKFIAYMFMIASLAHGGAYITYAFDPNNGGTEAKDEAFAYGNPTMTTTEGDAKSFWYTCTSDTGIGTLAFMIVLMLTALSSESGRLDPAVPIRQCLGFGTGQETAYPPTMEAQKRDERACVKTRSEIKGLANGKDGLLAPKLDWYIAKWEV